MTDGDPTRLCWSVRLEDEGDVVDDLIEVCRDGCASLFPATDGYVTSVRRLSGALDGANLVLVRSDFRALVSVQRFARKDDDATEIRVVGRCRHGERDPDGVAAHRSMTRWGIAGCAVGTMGVGTAGLELSGLLTAWGQVLLLIPALMAWRVCMALRIASNLRRRTRLGAHPAATRERMRGCADDLGRWKRLTEMLGAQRDVVADRARLRPFRSPGAASTALDRGSVKTRSMGRRSAPVPAPPPVRSPEYVAGYADPARHRASTGCTRA